MLSFAFLLMSQEMNQKEGKWFWLIALLIKAAS
jgi:hypothetical protein